MTAEEKLTLTRAEMSAWTADRLADRVLARRHRQEYNGTSPRWIWFKELSTRTFLAAVGRRGFRLIREVGR